MSALYSRVLAILMWIMALMPLRAVGQTHYSSNVAIGIKGGIDLSEVFFNPKVEQKIALGTAGGIMFRYIEENHFGLIAELNYSQRGWSEDFEDAPYNYTRTTNYIEIPVLAHIFFGRRGRFFFNAGPQVGLFLGDRVNANFDPNDMAELPDFPYKNRMNEQMLLKIKQKFDYGITGGLGCEFNINRNNSLCLEGRYYFGLGNIFSAKRADTYHASNQWTVAVTIGYWLRVK